MINKIKIPILIVVLLFTASDLMAQVLNVERFKTSADTSNVWAGSVSFGFHVADQGQRELNLRNDANLTYYSKRHQYLMLNRINLRQIGDNTSRNGYLHLRAILFRQNRINPEAFTQFQYNIDLGLQRRALAGANARFRFYESEKFSGAISTGLMIENELWKEEVEKTTEPTQPLQPISEDWIPETYTEIERTENTLLKSTTSLNLRGNVTDDISIVVFSYYQAKPGDYFQPRITADWQIQYRLRENIRLGVQFVATYDAAPVLDAADFVYSFNNILILSF